MYDAAVRCVYSLHIRRRDLLEKVIVFHLTKKFPKCVYIHRSLKSENYSEGCTRRPGLRSCLHSN
jgi:hypothetical protein